MANIQKFKFMPREKYEPWFKNHHVNGGECLMCNLGIQIMIKEWKYWAWVANPAPYFDYHTVLMPKRYIKHLSDLTLREFSEFKKIYHPIIEAFSDAKFRHRNNKQIVKYIMFVRPRDDRFDHSNDITRPEHLHIHITPDFKGFFDPLLHKDAHKKAGFDKKLQKLIKFREINK